MFPNIFREFPKFSEDCRRLPRKIRRFFDLISIYFGSFSIGTWQTLQADWSKMISHMCGYHFYPHMWDTIFLDLLPLTKALINVLINKYMKTMRSSLIRAVRDLQIRVRVRLFNPSTFALDYHISHQSRTDSLLFNWSATGRSEGSGNITGLKFKSRTCT